MIESVSQTHERLQKEAALMKTKILFLCTGNSCRSQMAEGWACHLKGDVIDTWSGGIEKHGLNPLAVKAMAEVGVDISGHNSKLIEELPTLDFDYVITVCDNAHESCPSFRAKPGLSIKDLMTRLDWQQILQAEKRQLPTTDGFAMKSGIL